MHKFAVGAEKAANIPSAFWAGGRLFVCIAAASLQSVPRVQFAGPCISILKLVLSLRAYLNKVIVPKLQCDRAF